MGNASRVPKPESTVFNEDELREARRTFLSSPYRGVVIQEKGGNMLLPCFVLQTPREPKFYNISPLPKGKRALKDLEGDGWRPTKRELRQIPKKLSALENQEPGYLNKFDVFGVCCWCLCPYSGPFTLPFMKINTAEVQFEISKPDCTYGGYICCPQTTDLWLASHGELVNKGKVQEDCYFGKNYFKRGAQWLFCCIAYYDLKVADNRLKNFTPRYKLLVNTGCVGPHNNCYGATWVHHNMLFNVYQYSQNGKSDEIDPEPVAYIQKTYAPESYDNFEKRTCFSCCYSNGNYIIEFPKDAEEVDRGLFMSAFVSTEYGHFTKTCPSFLAFWNYFLCY